jgi:hypothetical protein
MRTSAAAISFAVRQAGISSISVNVVTESKDPAQSP